MKTIPLTRGCVALVDDEDYASLSRFLWRAQVTGRTTYAVRGGSRSPIFMHQQILGPTPPGLEIDHRVHATQGVADNRRANLRFVEPARNCANRRKRSGLSSSVFKGVSFNQSHNKWQAYIQAGRRFRSLGYFAVEAHAAYAYDLAAVTFWGDHALTNFPVPGSSNWLFGKEASLAATPTSV